MGLAVDGAVAGAQHLVPVGQVGERGGEGGRVEGGGGAQDERDVVGGAGAFEGVDEPEAALRVRERKALGAVGAGDGPESRRGVGLVAGGADAPGEGGGRGGEEEVADLDVGAEPGADPVGEADAAHGVAADGEEALVGADLVEAEGFGEEGAQGVDELPVGGIVLGGVRARRGVGRGGGAVAAGVEGAPVGGGDEALVRDGGGRVVGGGAQRGFEGGEEEPGDVLVEDVPGVFEGQGESGGRAVGVAVVDAGGGEVELGGGGPLLGREAAGEAAEGEGLRVGSGGAEGEHHLEEGVDARCAGRVEVFDEQVEGEPLVGEGGEVGVADAVDEVGGGGRAGGVGGQDEGVDEEADEVVEGFVVAACDGGAEGEPFAGAGGAQGEAEGGLEDHEEAGVVVLGEADEPGVDGGFEAGGDEAAGVVAEGGPGPVEGQRGDGGQGAEGVPPVGEALAGDGAGVVGVAEHVVLPEGVVGVLDGQRLPLRRAAPGAGGVGGGEVGHERGERPAVAGDVVEQDREGGAGAVLGEEEGDAQREFAGEVEGLGGEAGDEAGQGARRGFDGPEAYRARGEDVLVGLAVGGEEDGAERLVAFGEVGDGGGERGAVGGRVQVEDDRHVVGGGGAVELVDEPEAALGVGERHPLVGGERVLVDDGEPGVGGAEHLAVDLARAGARQGDDDRDDGHGRGGHPLAHPVAQFLGAGAAVGDDEGDEALDPVGVLLGDDGGLADGGMSGEDGVDGGGVDALASDLDLVVETSVVEDLAVVANGDQVAGAVGAFAVELGEAAGVQLGPVEVAAGQTAAEEPELPFDDGGADAGEGAADGDGPRVVPGEVRDGGHDGGLGGPVGVEQPDAVADEAAPLGDPLGQGGLAVDDDGAQRRGEPDRAGGEDVHQLVPVGGGQVEEGDAGPFAAGEEFADVEHVVGAEHEGAAGAQDGEDLLDAGVEVQRAELQDAGVGVDAVRGGGAGDEVGEGVVGDDDAVGNAGGAGGVDDVRGALSRAGPVEDELAVAGDLGGLGGGVAAGVPEDGGVAGVGGLHVEREVGGAGGEDGEEADDRVDAARPVERHEAAGSGAPGGEFGGPGADGGAESGVGQARVGVDQGHGLGAGALLGGDEVEHRRRGGGRGSAVEQVVRSAAGHAGFLR